MPVNPSFSCTYWLNLVSKNNNVIKEIENNELCYRINTQVFSIAIFITKKKVSSVWFDDPFGRKTASGRKFKIESYLARYGNLSNWEKRMNNNWMEYYYNPIDKVSMVYGIHNDVIRFNEFEEIQ